MFQPKNWTASLEGAYFDVVSKWSDKEFEDVVDTSLNRYEYMPKPGQEDFEPTKPSWDNIIGKWVWISQARSEENTTSSQKNLTRDA